MTDGAGVTRNSELNAKNKFREAALSARAPYLDLQIHFGTRYKRGGDL
jgi:hypothetical protein